MEETIDTLRSTSHCFEDYNHVDCCTMASDTSHRTNEESKVQIRMR